MQFTSSTRQEGRKSLDLPICVVAYFHQARGHDILFLIVHAAKNYRVPSHLALRLERERAGVFVYSLLFLVL